MGAHDRKHCTCHVDGTKQICLDSRPEVLGRELLEEPCVEVARVVDEDVDAPEPRDGGRHGRLALLGTCDIELADQQLVRLAEHILHGFAVSAGGDDGVPCRQRLELTNDEGFVDIVERGFDAGVRLGESVHRDMVAVPLTGPLTMTVVASPKYLSRLPAPRHPSDLQRHNCIRFRLTGTGRICKWEFQIDKRIVEYEVKGNLTISDSTFGLDAAMEGIGLAYIFEALALPHIRAKRLKRVLTSFSPTFPGFYLYYPNREHQSTKMKALIDYVRRVQA